jgi:hypothetical protein
VNSWAAADFSISSKYRRPRLFQQDLVDREHGREQGRTELGTDHAGLTQGHPLGFVEGLELPFDQPSHAVRNPERELRDGRNESPAAAELADVSAVDQQLHEPGREQRLALAALGRGEAMTRQTLAPIRRALSPSTHFALMLVLALVTALSAVALGHDLIASTERGVRRPPHGRLEVTIAGPCAAGEQQVFPGNLRLRSLDERVEAVISGFEIAVGAASRRELPAGTYALTWSMDPLAPAQGRLGTCVARVWSACSMARRRGWRCDERAKFAPGKAREPCHIRAPLASFRL